jgi:hypothetical protein
VTRLRHLSIDLRTQNPGTTISVLHSGLSKEYEDIANFLNRGFLAEIEITIRSSRQSPPNYRGSLHHFLYVASSISNKKSI